MVERAELPGGRWAWASGMEQLRRQACQAARRRSSGILVTQQLVKEEDGNSKDRKDQDTGLGGEMVSPGQLDKSTGVVVFIQASGVWCFASQGLAWVS